MWSPVMTNTAYLGPKDPDALGPGTLHSQPSVRAVGRAEKKCKLSQSQNQGCHHVGKLEVMAMPLSKAQ